MHTAPCDVSDADAVAAYIEAAATALGGIDGLVNNPSGFGATDDEDGWKKSMDVDLMGVVRAIWAAYPHLVASKGSVLTISSISGIGASGSIPYGAVKAAVAAVLVDVAALRLDVGVCEREKQKRERTQK